MKLVTTSGFAQGISEDAVADLGGGGGLGVWGFKPPPPPNNIIHSRKLGNLLIVVNKSFF